MITMLFLAIMVESWEDEEMVWTDDIFEIFLALFRLCFGGGDEEVECVR